MTKLKSIYINTVKSFLIACFFIFTLTFSYAQEINTPCDPTGYSDALGNVIGSSDCLTDSTGTTANNQASQDAAEAKQKECNGADNYDCYTLLESFGSESSVDITEGGLGIYLEQIMVYFLMIVTIAAVFFMIYGGILYLTTDIVSKKAEGREIITRVVIGLIFVFSVWTIMNSINSGLLKNSLNFSLKNIGVVIKNAVTGTTNTTTDPGTDQNPTPGTGKVSDYSCPVSGKVISGMYRTSNPSAYHGAVDIAVSVGTQIKAPMAGTVFKTSLNNGACGHTLIFKDSNEMLSIFCHLSEIKRKTGEVVQKGEILGLTGGQPGSAGAGSSQGPHLHWQTGGLKSPNSLENRKAELICGAVSK
jgi:biotin carboxyl carrier protein